MIPTTRSVIATSPSRARSTAAGARAAVDRDALHPPAHRAGAVHRARRAGQPARLRRRRSASSLFAPQRRRRSRPRRSCGAERRCRRGSATCVELRRRHRRRRRARRSPSPSSTPCSPPAAAPTATRSRPRDEAGLTDRTWCCDDRAGGAATREAAGFNGIDSVEVVTRRPATLGPVPPPAAGSARRRPPRPCSSADNVASKAASGPRRRRSSTCRASGDELTVDVDRAGDFSTYTVRIVAAPATDLPPSGFDPALVGGEFSFKAGCPTPFDCEDPNRAGPPRRRARVSRLPRPATSSGSTGCCSDRLALALPDVDRPQPRRPAGRRCSRCSPTSATGSATSRTPSPPRHTSAPRAAESRCAATPACSTTPSTTARNARGVDRHRARPDGHRSTAARCPPARSCCPGRAAARRRSTRTTSPPSSVAGPSPSRRRTPIGRRRRAQPIAFPHLLRRRLHAAQRCHGGDAGPPGRARAGRRRPCSCSKRSAARRRGCRRTPTRRCGTS